MTLNGGSLTLYGIANTYTDATTVNGGTLIGGAANTFSAAARPPPPWAALSISAALRDYQHLYLAGGTIQHGTLTSANGIASTDGTVNNIAGTTTLKTTSGITKLTDTNTYTGATTVNGGTLRGGATNAFSANSSVTVSALRLSRSGRLQPGHRLAGGCRHRHQRGSSSPATLTAGGNNANTMFSGIIRDGAGTSTTA